MPAATTTTPTMSYDIASKYGTGRFALIYNRKPKQLTYWYITRLKNETSKFHRVYHRIGSDADSLDLGWLKNRLAIYLHS